MKLMNNSDPPPPPKRHGELERDPGTKSEGEDDSQHGNAIPCKKSLGKTPNHLTLRYVLIIINIFIHCYVICFFILLLMVNILPNCAFGRILVKRSITEIVELYSLLIPKGLIFCQKF